MLAIEITLLTGRYVATSEAARGQPEWPPHPARVFSALVAAWADGDPGVDDDERAVLQWLERLPAPEIVASTGCERTAVTHYVPINDTSVIGRSETERRAGRIDDLLAQLDQARGSTGAGAARKVTGIEQKIASQRDVSKSVAAAGKTNVRDAEALLPSGRNRQPRQWPSVTAEEPVVTLRWPEIDAAARTVDVLDGLCARVPRLGHSSSLVSVRAMADMSGEADARWVPDADGSKTLRWVQQGQLRALERAYAGHQASRPRSLPKVGISYRDTLAQPALEPTDLRSNLGGEWFTFMFVSSDGGRQNFGRRMPLTRTVELAKTLHQATISHAREPVHPVISGHDAEGQPVRDPHLAFLALPFVGHEHATGLLLGLAVLLPTEIDDDARSEVLAALGNWTASGAELKLGERGRVRLDRPDPDPKSWPRTLWRSTWSGPARTWVSATPIALPRHPGALAKGTASARARAWRKAETAVVRACTYVGLPEPVEVGLSLAPRLQGSERAARFPAFRQGGTARALVHATVTFGEPIDGPLVLGAGRFAGLGLMRPLRDEEGRP